MRYVKKFYDIDGDFLRESICPEGSAEIPTHIRKALRMNGVSAVEVHLKNGMSYEIVEMADANTD